MNLHKKCRRCKEFFVAKPLSLEIFCNKIECQNRKSLYLSKIKRNRFVTADYFDIYDLNRPTESGYSKFERVCRFCGKPILKKNGEYSPYMRYCQEHRTKGYELFRMYNWGACSKEYIFHIQEKFKEDIMKKVKEMGFLKKDTRYFVLCESCNKVCLTYSAFSYKINFKICDIINVHHIKPIHTLTWEDLYLIWDFSNLMCLCQKCHSQQDHKFKKIEVNLIENKFKFKTIKEFL